MHACSALVLSLFSLGRACCAWCALWCRSCAWVTYLVQELADRGSLAQAIRAGELALHTYTHAATPRHSHSRTSAGGAAGSYPHSMRSTSLPAQGHGHGHGGESGYSVERHSGPQSVCTPPRTPLHGRSHGGHGAGSRSTGGGVYAPCLLTVMHTAKEVATAIAYMHAMGVVHG